MGLYDDLVAAGNGPDPVRQRKGAHPAGWEPGVAWDGTKGTLTTAPLDSPPNDWAELLAVWGLDPKLHEVVEPVGFRAWDAVMGEGRTQRMYYYRANVRLRQHGTRADVEELCRLISRHRKPKAAAPSGGRAFVVCLNDWQVGKADGDGSDGITRRILAAIDAVEQRIKELRKTGRDLGALYVIGLGDMIENCSDHYCVAADTPVLTDDLRWVPAGSLRPGDGLYALDEDGPGGNSWRKYAFGKVLTHEIRRVPSVRATFANGDSVVCTPEHPFLARKMHAAGGATPYRWVAARDLMTAPYEVAKMMTTWEAGTTRDHGWLAGLYDGEGSLVAGKRGGGPSTLGVSQLEGVVLDKARQVLSAMGVEYGDSTNTFSSVHTLRVTGGYSEVLRVLGTLRPERLLGKVGTPCAYAMESPRVVSVEDAGDQEIAFMGTSTKTYFANGYAVHNSQQAWRTELTLTEQVRVTRRLIVKALTRWAGLFEEVVVAAVPGNHGEVRQGGKSFTDFADNHDVDVFAAAAEVLAANPDTYGHVSFVFPQGQEITLTLDACGTVLGLAHGHQVKSVNKVGDWWAKQAHGRQPIGEADLLLTGHYHHLRVEQNQRAWIQAPALDGGSDWWRHLSGQDSPPGVLTLVVGGGSWSDLAVL